LRWVAQSSSLNPGGIVPWGQGYRDMSPAVDTLERLVEERKLRHGGHPVLMMAAGNAKVEVDAAGNRKLSKRRSTGRIDALQPPWR
jgi:phage terminase large subunit-like protein